MTIKNSFETLAQIISQLRDPNTGCPWDKEQTHQSLRPYVIEEAYEVIEAIDNLTKVNSNDDKANFQELKKELGDLLLQIFLHSQIASEKSYFTVEDVALSLSEKLIERHPHVFGDKSVNSSKEVTENWEKIKNKNKPKNSSILAGVPTSMPSLLRAERVSEKAARVGFEWDKFSEVKDKVKEEVFEFLAELPDELSKITDQRKIEDEFGDLLFSLIQISRRLGFSGENALKVSTDKFVRRFQEVEQLLNKPVAEATLEEMDKLWEEIKEREKR